MGSRTIALQDSAYARLRSARMPGESFTDTINRLLEGSRPTFGSLVGALTADDTSDVRDAVARFRASEAAARSKSVKKNRRAGGHRSRQ